MLEHHSSYKVRRKSENDFVTEMDYKSETLIRDMLLTACPEDEFYGEEGGGATQAPGRWVVDPIDGTVNFMRGHRTYAISIAYEQAGELVIGCVYVPGTDQLYLGVKGEGATLNGKPIHVSDTSVLRDSLVEFGYGNRNFAHYSRTMPIMPRLLLSVSDIRRMGSAAYGICAVAAGANDAFFEQGLGLYDFAAGCVVLREAGGQLTGWDRDEDGVKTGNVLASNGVIHEPLREILLGEAGPEELKGFVL